MKKIISFLILFFFITACGLSPIYINKKNNFSVSSIQINGEKKISYKIRNNLRRYLQLKDKPNSYKLDINANKKIRISSKDQKGNPKTFEIIIEVELLTTKENTVYKKKFVRTFSYQNQENKFNLKNYENEIIENLSEKIILEINDYLFNLSE